MRDLYSSHSAALRDALRHAVERGGMSSLGVLHKGVPSPSTLTGTNAAAQAARVRRCSPVRRRMSVYTCTRARDNLAFDAVTVDRFTIRLREGGTVACIARTQVHPRTEAVTAKQVTLLKHKIPATLDAGKATDESESDE